MPEAFAIPCVGAIISQEVGGVPCILLQERRKPSAGRENGMLEVAAGKIREYENVFDALRREVHEETGLTLTHIQGEESSVRRVVNGYEVLSLTPFCVTQNLSGGYSILLHSFICQAEGSLSAQKDETANLRWMPLTELQQMLEQQPEAFYPLHVNALHKYLKEQQ